MKNSFLLMLLLFLSLIFSCQDGKRSQIISLLQEWEGKEIIFPEKSIISIQYSDTLSQLLIDSEYKILTYIDSAGCTDCKLKLFLWNKLIHAVDSLNGMNVSFIFYSNMRNKDELERLIRRDNFAYPIFLDVQNQFYQLNNLSANITYQTFLLDRSNRVIAIGNPIHNPQIKELYLNIIQEKCPVSNKEVRTEVDIKDKSIFLGKFDWQQEQKAVFTLKNTGTNPLVVDNVSTSCGCTSVDYSKEPIRPGNSISLNVTYKADHPEHFDKTITVYCNAASSPIVLQITGTAR